MSTLADRIKEVAPLAEPPAYRFLLKTVGEIADQLNAAADIRSKRSGFGLCASVQRHAPVVWDAAVWKACTKFGPDAVRVAGFCLKKRGLLSFLPKSRQRSTFDVILGKRNFPLTSVPGACARPGFFFLHESAILRVYGIHRKNVHPTNPRRHFAKSIDEHLGLYQGYVKNFNAITAKLVEYAKEGKETHAIALRELIRLKSFEFDGMRLHELYFTQFEGGAKALDENSALSDAFKKEYHEYFKEYFTAIGLMRGPGWAMLYYDPIGKQFQAGFSGEQHQGHFVTLSVILALDVWEHAFLLDYGAQGKAKYIEAFFKNLNWKVVEERFSEAQNSLSR